MPGPEHDLHLQQTNLLSGWMCKKRIQIQTFSLKEELLPWPVLLACLPLPAPAFPEWEMSLIHCSRSHRLSGLLEDGWDSCWLSSGVWENEPGICKQTRQAQVLISLWIRYDLEQVPLVLGGWASHLPPSLWVLKIAHIKFPAHRLH